MWADYLTKHANAFEKQPEAADSAVRETARQLMNAGKFNEVVGMVRAALRTGHPQPWMYEVMALAMQAGGNSSAEIERALMSAVDFGESSEELMYVAQYMARSGLEARALKVFRQVAHDRAPPPGAILVRLAVGGTIGRHRRNSLVESWAS